MILHWPTLGFSPHHPGPRSRGRPPSPSGTPSCDPPPGRPTPPGRCSSGMMDNIWWKGGNLPDLPKENLPKMDALFDVGVLSFCK